MLVYTSKEIWETKDLHFHMHLNLLCILKLQKALILADNGCMLGFYKPK